MEKKNLHPLINEPSPDKEHAILNTEALKDSDINVNFQPEQEFQQNNSVWPVESNILIEVAKYENNNLNVTLTNLSFDSIKIIEMGVKYSSNDYENIEFQPANITIPPGESTIQIPCPKGNPFKFVFRTANRTGAGMTQDNMNW